VHRPLRFVSYSINSYRFNQFIQEIKQPPVTLIPVNRSNSFLELKMMSIQQIRRFFVTMILTIMLAITIAFDFGTTDSWAATLPTQLISQPQTQIATMNRAEAMTKNIEGKVQEAIGNITGDPKEQMMGKAKQVESQARNAAEDLKGNMELKGRAKAVTKNIEGKSQEAIGKATGNRNDQVAGKAKQAESQARNVVEDVKDAVQNIFN
jgi:uncharacterized protein YjbJ (UPF0337 family)